MSSNDVPCVTTTTVMGLMAAPAREQEVYYLTLISALKVRSWDSVEVEPPVCSRKSEGGLITAIPKVDQVDQPPHFVSSNVD